MSDKTKEVALRWTVIWYSSHEYLEDLDRMDLQLGRFSSPEMAAETAVRRWFDEGDIEVDDVETSIYVTVVDPVGRPVKVKVDGEQGWRFNAKRLEG
jgi:hypothetical protein